jgi:hypothetical protein
MTIEAVVVCVDYADFLAWTLPINKQYFDQMVVVTSPTDLATQKLCEFWHVRCVVTNAFYENGDPFNKGKGINVGLASLTGKDWVVHLDADMVLPPRFRAIVEQLELDTEGIYGIDRMMCDDFRSWLRYWYRPTCSNECDIYVHLAPFRVGTRIARADKEYGGWVPIGFFQMWNQGARTRSYPNQHTDAGRSDILFALQFPRKHRHLLAEVVGIHLETKVPNCDRMGANWNGRKTPWFGWELVEDSVSALDAQAQSDYYDGLGGDQVEAEK